MKKKQILEFKLLFEEQRRKLSETHMILNDSWAVQPDDLFDLSDLTSREMEASMQMQLRNREILQSKKLDEALRRIAKGTFGECEECGQDIDIRRLQASPTTTLCVNCKEEQETLEQRHVNWDKSKTTQIRLGLA